jgi:hypothetical protein
VRDLGFVMIPSLILARTCDDWKRPAPPRSAAVV